MICSLSELGLEDASDGIYIFPNETKLGLSVNELLNLGDTILEINVTPNRPDCLSMIGVAREVSALFERSLKLPKKEIKTVAGKTDRYIKVEDTDACPIYVSRIIKGIKVGISPLWLQSRLRSAGIRSINNVVDITNYILLEYNQPLHAFDNLKIDKGIIVRRATKSERVTTLDTIDRELTVENLVITDESRVLAVAGVMGGLYSSITDETDEIFLECAYFDPNVIRRSSKLLFLSSDSSYRYERGIDSSLTESILDYAAMMICEIAGGEIIDIKLGERFKELEQAEVITDPNYVNQLLGTDIVVEDMLKYLNLLSIDTTIVDKKLRSVVPFFRIDITRPADITEEIARLYGYNNIEATISAVALDNDSLQGIPKLLRDLRIRLESLGFNESINFSFMNIDYLTLFDKDDGRYVKLLNPISQDMAVMRRSVFPALLKNLESNWNQSERSIKLFEIASTYKSSNDNEIDKDNDNIKYKSRGSKLPVERQKLAIAMMGKPISPHWVHSSNVENFFYLKGVLEHIFSALNLDAKFVKIEEINFLHQGRSSDIFIENINIGFIGELHPIISEKLDLKDRVMVSEIDLDSIEELISNIKIKYKKFSKFQIVERDLSIVIDKTILSDDIKSTVSSISDKIIDVTIFDIYEGKELGDDKKAMAFRLRIADQTKTLSEEEITDITDQVLQSLTLKFLAKLR